MALVVEWYAKKHTVTTGVCRRRWRTRTHGQGSGSTPSRTVRASELRPGPRAAGPRHAGHKLRVATEARGP